MFHRRSPLAWRGFIERAIEAGDEETGVTIMRLNTASSTPAPGACSGAS